MVESLSSGRGSEEQITFGAPKLPNPEFPQFENASSNSSEGLKKDPLILNLINQ